MNLSSPKKNSCVFVGMYKRDLECEQKPNKRQKVARFLPQFVFYVIPTFLTWKEATLFRIATNQINKNKTTNLFEIIMIDFLRHKWYHCQYVDPNGLLFLWQLPSSLSHRFDSHCARFDISSHECNAYFYKYGSWERQETKELKEFLISATIDECFLSVRIWIDKTLRKNKRMYYKYPNVGSFITFASDLYAPWDSLNFVSILPVAA